MDHYDYVCGGQGTTVCPSPSDSKDQSHQASSTALVPQNHCAALTVCFYTNSSTWVSPPQALGEPNIREILFLREKTKRRNRFH